MAYDNFTRQLKLSTAVNDVEAGIARLVTAVYDGGWSDIPLYDIERVSVSAGSILDCGGTAVLTINVCGSPLTRINQTVY